MPTYVAGSSIQRKENVAEGEYNLAIINAEEVTASSGNTMIKLKIDVTGPVDGDAFAEGTGPIVYDNLVFTEAAFWKIDQFLAAIGESPEEGQEVNVEPDDLIGAVLKAHIIVGKTNTGKTRNEVSAYLSEDPF